MPDTRKNLGLRVRDYAPGEPKALEVLDEEGNVLGDLAASTTACEYNMGMGGDLSVVKITVAVERAHIDSIEMGRHSMNRQLRSVS